MELELDKLYCDHRLNIVAKSPSVGIHAVFNLRVGKNWINTIKQNYVEIENKGQTISQTGQSFITDLFELQSKFEQSIFIRSTALLKQTIEDKDWYLDKYYIIKTKSNPRIISIAIHKTNDRKKIIDTHEALWQALRKYKWKI